MGDQAPQFSTEEQIRALIEQLSAYIETYHGGSVDFVAFDGNVVQVRWVERVWAAPFRR